MSITNITKKSTFVSVKEYYPVLKILGRFIIIYLVLLLIYQLYLNYYEHSVVDPYTYMITKQCASIQNFLGYETVLVPSKKYPGILYYVNGQIATIMVEGCNVISILILFVAFIFTFYRGFKLTFLYTLAGIVILYILNVLRIAFINIVAIRYPEYFKDAHDYIFPAIIYGGVVVLWLVWIKKFALKEDEEGK